MYAYSYTSVHVILYLNALNSWEFAARKRPKALVIYNKKDVTTLER